MTRRAAMVGAAVLAASGSLVGGVASASPAGRVAPPAVIDATWNPNAVAGRPGPAARWPADWPRPVRFEPTARGSLTGRTIYVDPGHNSGNMTHRQINRHYWVGLDKACNTTGTETPSGFLEARYTFDVATRLVERLRGAGARVVLSRGVDGRGTYGPCIQARGLLGGQAGADIGVSIHADGAPSSGRGAFVYYPGRMAGYTSSAKATRSERLGRDILLGFDRVGLRRSTYLTPLVGAHRDQGTLNMSAIPIVIVETLNMRNRADAAIAEAPSGRQRVADGLFDGIVRYFG